MEGDEEVTNVIKSENGETVKTNDNHMYEDTSMEEFDKNIEEKPVTSEAVDDSPLDLRTAQVQTLPKSKIPKSIIYPKKDKKEVISIAELLENFYYDETLVTHNCYSKLHAGNMSSLNEFEGSSCEENLYSNNAIDYSVKQKIYSHMKYECFESACNTELYWNIAANSNTVDSETKTQTKETMDTSVQTDLKPDRMAYSVIKNIHKTDLKLTCTICKRIYASKSSYERHLRTHLALPSDKKFISSVFFTTEAKLELCQKEVARKHTSEPIIIQMPHTNKNIQCESCKELFATQSEKDDHLDDCIIEPFFMTKCPECSIKFYTLECLNRHIGLVHKNHSSTNAYYCIFCNENFDTAFTFQIHLDNHLSP